MKRVLPIIIFLTLIFTSVPRAQAAGAVLLLSPGSGTNYIGSLFTVNVKAHTGGQAANAFEGTVTFPTDKLEATQATTGGSICSLFARQPIISNDSGTVFFSCGLPNPGYIGTAGQLISISFRAKAAGVASLSIGGGKVLANDGAGTNIFANPLSATFNLQPAMVNGPAIFSSTHPDQNAWYKEKTVALNWSKSDGTSGFSYEFNQLLETIPDQTEETGDTKVQFENKDEGVWYFSLRAKGKDGWSSTSHFRVGIDTTPPETLEVVSEPMGEISVRPMISFNATDATSGIDHYEIALDAAEWKKATSPYKPDTISSGEHTFKVKAVDKAGNEKQGEIKVKIKEIPRPVLTSPVSGVTLKLAEGFKIIGRSQAGLAVNIYLDGKKIKENLEASKEGGTSYGLFTSEYNELLMPGKHSLWAVAIQDGIESGPSEKIEVNVDPTALVLGGWTIPGAVVIVGLLIIIGLLAFILAVFFIFTKKQLGKIRQKFNYKLVKVEEKVVEDFTRLEKTLEKDVEGVLDKASDQKPAQKMEHQLEDKIEKDLEKTESDLKKKIEEEKKN